MSWTKASHWNTVLNPRDCGFSLSLPTVPFVRSSLTTHLRLELNTTVHCTIHGWTTCYHCTVHTYLWTPISHTLSAVWKIKEHNQGAQPGLNQISGLDITITSPLKFHHQHGRYHCQACLLAGCAVSGAAAEHAGSEAKQKQKSQISQQINGLFIWSELLRQAQHFQMDAATTAS